MSLDLGITKFLDAIASREPVLLVGKLVGGGNFLKIPSSSYITRWQSTFKPSVRSTFSFSRTSSLSEVNFTMLCNCL